MKKILLIFFFSFSTYLFPNSDANLFKQKEINDYANIYADFLIEEFDQSLTYSLTNSLTQSFLSSLLYAKIQAARTLIEETGEVIPFKNGGLIKIKKSKVYQEVVELIDKNAKILFEQTSDKTDSTVKNNDRNLVVYPSRNGDGNLTGNTYPPNVWSLSFDDGPRDLPTKTVVDNLYLHGYKASFFMLMRQVKKFPKSVDYVLDHDMEIALHSYTHKDLNKASDELAEYEIGTALAELKELAKTNITLFRLPYGSGLRNRSLREKIEKYALVHIFWNVDTLDWKDKNPESIFKRTLKQMEITPRKSGIILFHDIHAQTVIASEMLIKFLKEENKTVCLIGEMIKYFNNQAQDCLK